MPDSNAARAGETLSQSLYDALRADLVGGILAPRAPLRLDELRRRHGTSASPLREALSRLAAEGFVLAESQRGFRVAPVSRNDLFDLAERRIELETNALARSIERGGVDWEGDVLKSHHQFSRLSREVAAGTRPLDATWEQRHRALHFSLLESCGSPWLLRLCGQLYDHFDRYRRLAQLPAGSLGALTADEDRLVAAALDHEAARAVDVLKAHVLRTRDAIAASPAIAAAAP
jgi:GntR family transcriptional regulator, carbon starvation induced regulator